MAGLMKAGTGSDFGGEEMEKLVMDITSADNKYLRKDFHVTGDNGLMYESVHHFIAKC